MNAEEDSEPIQDLKKFIYQLLYMDNGAVTMNDSESLKWAYECLEGIFQPYQFELQQYVTNDEGLQRYIDANLDEKTPSQVKLLGLCWDRVSDTLSTKKMELDGSASTKRQILRSIASQYDVYNFNGPLLNRSRLFLHDLQYNKMLGWDDKLSPELVREWQNITKQINAAPVIEVKRFDGKRNSSYRLIAFTDSSKQIYGTVVYIQDIETNLVSFLPAPNRIVNKQLEMKSVPSLEFLAVSFGTEVLAELYQELCGDSCIKPIKVVDMHLYSDSFVSFMAQCMSQQIG
ncbi:uncharacterized protein [Macrobrachium rosenbergii]|uniref:uncharacterized protein n=1 Tax=Macrobrachium rosenbergii TaxID=79674 RepID=UPI0034D5B78C